MKAEDELQQVREEMQTIQTSLGSLLKKDTGIEEDVEQLLDQTQRNVNQGVLGQSLAQSKVSLIKAHLGELQSNLKEESKDI